LLRQEPSPSSKSFLVEVSKRHGANDLNILPAAAIGVMQSSSRLPDGWSDVTNASS
jgi:hypothetical protein